MFTASNSKGKLHFEGNGYGFVLGFSEPAFDGRPVAVERGPQRKPCFLSTLYTMHYFWERAFEQMASPVATLGSAFGTLGNRVMSVGYFLKKMSI